jgi:hypothetical protein
MLLHVQRTLEINMPFNKHHNFAHPTFYFHQMSHIIMTVVSVFFRLAFRMITHFSHIYFTLVPTFLILVFWRRRPIIN